MVYYSYGWERSIDQTNQLKQTCNIYCNIK